MARTTPIFVIGYQRSGTTLLQALLGAHSRIAAAPEIYFHYRVAGHANYFGDLADDRNLRRALHEALNPPIDVLGECGFDEDRLLSRALTGSRTYGALLDVMLSDFAERLGKKRWSEKSPGQTIDEALSLCPHAQILHIIRDPRDVVASALRAPWEHRDATGLARDWRQLTLRTIRRGFELGPSQFLQLHYEHLALAPDVVLRRICSFLEEPYEPGMITARAREGGAIANVTRGWQGRAAEVVEVSGEGAWQERLAGRDQFRVQAAVGSVLGPLGYRPLGFTTRVRTLPMLAAGAATRLWEHNAKPPTLTAEQKYELAQRYMAERVQQIRSQEGASVERRHGSQTVS